MPFQGVVLWIKVSVTRKMRYQRTIVPAPAIKIPNLERAKFYHSSPVFLHTYEIELSDVASKESRYSMKTLGLPGLEPAVLGAAG